MASNVFYLFSSFHNHSIHILPFALRVEHFMVFTVNFKTFFSRILKMQYGQYDVFSLYIKSKDMHK